MKNGKPLTIIHMNEKPAQRIRPELCAILLFLVFGICGCDWVQNRIPDNGISGNRTAESGEPPGSSTNENQSNAPLGTHAVFELPAGWVIKSEGGHVNAVLDHEPAGSIAPYILLEFSTETSGGEVEAAQQADKYFSQQQQGNPASPPTFSEHTLAGLKVYIIEENVDSAWGGPVWSTLVFFAKDGYVCSVSVWDRFDNQQQAIETLVQTLKRQ